MGELITRKGKRGRLGDFLESDQIQRSLERYVDGLAQGDRCV